MKETADNKNITSVERRILKFFFALTDKEKNMGELAKMLGISVSTAKRYANILEKAGIVCVRDKYRRRGKSAVLCKNMYFSIVRIGKNTIAISLSSYLPKYEYSVILPYNEALTEADNALCLKRTLKNLHAQMRAEKVFIAFVMSDNACIGENILCETVYGNTINSEFESKILTNSNKKARDISKEESISALVIEIIRNVRNKTGDQVSSIDELFSLKR